MDSLLPRGTSSRYIGFAVFAFIAYKIISHCNKSSSNGSPQYDTYSQDDLAKQQAALQKRCMDGDGKACAEYGEKWDADSIPQSNPFR